MKKGKNDTFTNTFIKDTLGCIGCGKCSAACPAGIDILEALQIYEKYHTGNPDVWNRLNGMKSDGKPIDCIECGACSAHCPKGIAVKKIMRTLAMMQSSKTQIPFMIEKETVK